MRILPDYNLKTDSVLQGHGAAPAGAGPRGGPDAGHHPVLGAAQDRGAPGHRDRGHLPDRLQERQLPVPADRGGPGVAALGTRPRV